MHLHLNSLVYGLLAGTGVVAIYVFLRSAFRVDNGNIGVLTTFGKFVRSGDKLATFGPGLHWRAPWARAIEVSLAERSLSLGPDNKPVAIEALAGDGTRIRVNARLRYRVSAAHVETFLVEATDATEHLAGLFRQAVREQIARFAQKPTELAAFTALRMRMHELQLQIREAMADAALHDYGIVITAVDLLQIDPPEELIDALNAVITAESEANALVARTELSTQQRVLSAEQAIEIANARALATEAEIRTVGAELATLADQGVLRQYVARRKDEVMGGSRRVYLNQSSTNGRS